MLLRLIILCLLLTLPARAEEVVAGLSQTRVSITTNFHGSEILIFGAVKRETPAPDDQLHVIATVSSPLEPVVVRKKDRKMGIWVNTETTQIDFAPSFYAVRSTAPVGDILAPAEDLKHFISIDRAIRAFDGQIIKKNSDDFVQALIRVRTNEGLYENDPQGIELTEDTLFRASVALPANLTEGDYLARIFLVRNNQVIDVYSTEIGVRKVGLERWIYNLAHENPILYGLLSLLIAGLAGWGASAFFMILRH